MLAAEALHCEAVIHNFNREPFRFIERGNTSNDEVELNGRPLQVKTLNEVLSTRTKRDNFHVQIFF